MSTRSNVLKHIWFWLQLIAEGELPYHYWKRGRWVMWGCSFWELRQGLPPWFWYSGRTQDYVPFDGDDLTNRTSLVND